MTPARFKVIALLALLLGGLVFAAIAWRFREYLNREQLMGAVEVLREMGPWVFFGCMAVLPLFWVPLSPFLFVAPAFGLQTAILGSICALTFNMVIAWLVSGKWFRPLFVRIVSRFGYSIPELSERSMVGVAVLLRITPGMPFPLQNYLLGLARMPLHKYLAVSLPIVWAISASVIILGESIMKGNFRMAMIGVGLAVAVGVAFRFWRVRLQAKAAMQVERQNELG